jgi:uncharacterized protein (TIGR02271 family)
MSNTLMLEDVAALRGASVYDSTGDRIGTVEEIFYDEETRRPEWIGIGTGFFGTKRVLVPVDGARVEGDAVTVAYDRDRVKDSPDIDGDELSSEVERDLYAYYGLRSSVQTDAEMPVARDEDASVVRSEEELVVGKQSVEGGRIRIRKWVETEPVQVEVELKREKARVVREPVDGSVDAGEIGEGAEESEIVLREEQPVVGKQTVAKERIAVEKDVVSDRQTVGDEVRKERVEIEGDASDETR